MVRTALGVLYIIIGVVVASNHGYPLFIGSITDILSYLLAVILWPAVLLGANLHVAI